MKLIKYFLQRRSVTILLLVLVLAGGLFSYVKMGKLEDAPFTIKQALVLTSYPGASPSEVQSQVTDVLEEAIQSLGELYYLKTENRAGLSKITVYVKKETRADEMQQLWDKLRRKVGDAQSKLPAGAGRGDKAGRCSGAGAAFAVFHAERVRRAHGACADGARLRTAAPSAGAGRAGASPAGVHAARKFERSGRTLPLDRCCAGAAPRGRNERRAGPSAAKMRRLRPPARQRQPI